MAKILVVDDDPELSSVIQETLALEGFVVDTVRSALEAEDLLIGYPYDLIILDWMMPELTGIEFLRSLRARSCHTPVVMLTAMDSIDHTATGLDTGADDYLTKPFAKKELLARVRAVLRRPKRTETEELTIANITIETRSFRVRRDGEELKLTQQEFMLLEFLMRNKNLPFSSEMLLDRIWSTMSESSTDTVRVHMSRLRKKLMDSSNNCPIITMHRQGYMFVSEDSK